MSRKALPVKRFVTAKEWWVHGSQRWSLEGLRWLLLVFGAVSVLERLIAAGIGFVSRKVWKSLPWSALMVKCVNAVTSTWCSISPRYSTLLSSLCCVGRHFRPYEAMGIWACMVTLELPSNKLQFLHVPFSYIDLAQGRFFSNKDEQKWKGMSEDESLLESDERTTRTIGYKDSMLSSNLSQHYFLKEDLGS